MNIVNAEVVTREGICDGINYGYFSHHETWSYMSR
jgi:hypothetical protein